MHASSMMLVCELCYLVVIVTGCLIIIILFILSSTL